MKISALCLLLVALTGILASPKTQPLPPRYMNAAIRAEDTDGDVTTGDVQDQLTIRKRRYVLDQNEYKKLSPERKILRKSQVKESKQLDTKIAELKRKISSVGAERYIKGKDDDLEIPPPDKNDPSMDIWLFLRKSKYRRLEVIWFREKDKAKERRARNKVNAHTRRHQEHNKASTAAQDAAALMAEIEADMRGKRSAGNYNDYRSDDFYGERRRSADQSTHLAKQGASEKRLRKTHKMENKIIKKNSKNTLKNTAMIEDLSKGMGKAPSKTNKKVNGIKTHKPKIKQADRTKMKAVLLRAENKAKINKQKGHGGYMSKHGEKTMVKALKVTKENPKHGTTTTTKKKMMFVPQRSKGTHNRKHGHKNIPYWEMKGYSNKLPPMTKEHSVQQNAGNNNKVNPVPANTNSNTQANEGNQVSQEKAFVVLSLFMVAMSLYIVH